jgi:glycosyltransferase involved in cell wall biosynthesis
MSLVSALREIKRKEKEAASRSHIVLIPSFNTGAKLFETVAQARSFWEPVLVVVDGSTDGSSASLLRVAADDPGLRVLVLACNRGKGAAVLEGLRLAHAEGFTHALTMDADGQHPASLIPEFMALSSAYPEAMILGRPIFDKTAPRVRVHGRRISNGLVNLKTLWAGIGDALCGFRVYPIPTLKRIMESTRWMRGFDFDGEAAVRLVWAGVPPISRSVPVKYFRPDEGGVSHFHYVRDNVALSWMHARLMVELGFHIPALLARGAKSSPR